MDAAYEWRIASGSAAARDTDGMRITWLGECCYPWKAGLYVAAVTTEVERVSQSDVRRAYLLLALTDFCSRQHPHGPQLVHVHLSCVSAMQEVVSKELIERTNHWVRYVIKMEL